MGEPKVIALGYQEVPPPLNPWAYQADILSICRGLILNFTPLV